MGRGVMKIRISSKDIAFRAFNSGGKGGQHGNRSLNAIEVTHLPTGIQATASAKSQHRNRATALQILKGRLLAHYQAEAAKERQRPSMERVRTYHEPEDRVVDHRTGQRWSYRGTVGRGRIGGIVEAVAGELAVRG